MAAVGTLQHPLAATVGRSVSECLLAPRSGG